MPRPLPLCAYVWVSLIHPDAVPFASLRDGERFRFPRQDAPIVWTKLSRCRYLCPVTGRRYRAGRRSAVIRERS